MRYVSVAAAAVVVALIVVHGTIPEHFLVDSTTIALLVLLVAALALPFFPTIRKYIAELNLFGGGVKFRDEVERAAEKAESVAAKEAGEHRSPDGGHDESRERPPWPVFVNIGRHLYDLIEQDPKLAVVGLGIEVERAIKELVKGMGLDPGQRPIPATRAVSMMRRAKRIDAEEEALFLQLLRLTTVALFGALITKEDAYRFFSIVENLNDFSVGYSLNLSPNEDWEAQGLSCRFEHCIERMPLKRERGDGSCSVWGHECPGGPEQVSICKSEGVKDPCSRLTGQEEKEAGHQEK